MEVESAVSLLLIFQLEFACTVKNKAIDSAKAH